MTALQQRLTELLEPVVAGTGHDLDDLAVQQAGRRSVVRVVIDKDGGVSLDDVADVSRVVSEALDDLDARDPSAFAGAFTLEVSSPGVSRPLTLPRHWRRSTGRLVEAALTDGTTVTGRVLEADEAPDGGVVLDVAGSRRGLRYAELSRGTVQVEFSRPDGGTAR